jgi:hypothetical protein
MTARDESAGSWTLLTGHGHVLVEIARSPTARIRDIAAVVGLTERTVQVMTGMPTPARQSIGTACGKSPRLHDKKSGRASGKSRRSVKPASCS